MTKGKITLKTYSKAPVRIEKAPRRAVPLTILVIGVTILAVMSAPTFALPPVETNASPQHIGVAGMGGDLIGSNFTIANDSSLTETNPAVAYNPDLGEYLVVWYNDRPGNDDIQAQRVSTNGTLVGSPFYIAAGAGAERRFPDVAYNSDDKEYLVVWQETDNSTSQTTIRGRRVSWTGNLLTGVFNIFTGDPSLEPAVAYSTTSHKYLIVWYWFDMTGDNIMGRTYSTSTGLGSVQYISQDTTGSIPRGQPDVAYCSTRDEFLVVWRQFASGSNWDIYARLVAGDGTLLSPASIVVSTLGHDETTPAVAALPLNSNEGDYLVVWEMNTGSDTGIYALTVNVDIGGSPSVGSFPLIVYDSSENESAPAVAGNENGKRYLVTWKQHYKMDLGGGLFLEFDGIAGRAVSSDGKLSDGTFMDPGTWIGGMAAVNSAIAAGPLGDFLVAFDDTGLTSSRGIYGQVWGYRTYLPLAIRNH